MKRKDSFHIYDRRADYSVTNIRDILFDIDKTKNTVPIETEKSGTSRTQLTLIGKGGCGVRHFVAVNLGLAYASIMMNYTSYLVAMPFMVNHTAIRVHINHSDPDGPLDWPELQLILSFVIPKLGFIATLPAAILAKRCGAKRVMGTGLLIQSFMQMMVPAAVESGFIHFTLLLLFQCIAMAPSLPCTYMLLSNWIPPCERSRMVSIVGLMIPIALAIVNYLGTTICEIRLYEGWAAHFYLFSACSILLSMFFIFFMWENPEICPVISEAEKSYIRDSLSRFKRYEPKPDIPWVQLAKSSACWALWIADIGEALYLTTISILFSLYLYLALNDAREYDFLGLVLPGLVMVISSVVSAVVADSLIMRGKIETLSVRKLFNSIALFGAAMGMVVVSHTGCNATVALVISNITAIFNGVHASGFRANYLEVSHYFVGILVSIGRTFAAIICISWLFIVQILAISGEETLRKWQLVFLLTSVILAFSATVFIYLGSSSRQPWDQNIRFSGVKGLVSVSFTSEVDAGTSSNVKRNSI